ncbi:hypothetical protein RSOL_108030 [Rhizoctonia solani AG-3 Rhs1AP]|uniref:Uncharacterized protein n=2 Tax=Rhizoctonia solani AG-3 TaxID=1086053 RepID=A0A074RM16_9AGAM|nr:hypothetical protein RSOL_108030 [Rhizoctonia solani AG-3 Rhs1AP]KEP48136.1 hypothetical protein V565_132980 [Rhizoctonia solani 123E]
MYVYVGKLNWFDYAKNECITIVFPAGFALKDPVCAYWQWTVDGQGTEKANSSQLGLITSVTKTTTTYYIKFPFDYYAFSGTVSPDSTSLSLTMSNPGGDTKDLTLSRKLGDMLGVLTTSVYIGKLNWFDYSKDEMVTLVIPVKAQDKPVIMSHQWTRDGAGTEKANHTVVGTLDVQDDSSKDSFHATFNDGYYKYELTITEASNQLVLKMTNPSNDRDSNAPYVLNQTDFRNLDLKKALIVRFNTGSDDGIFMVRDMLVDHLGFAKGNVELSYFDVDEENKAKERKSGQDPPTATNFKSKFTQLCRTAVAGNVRFLYVDAHGTTYSDENNSGEEKDQGWILAKDDAGTDKEIVDDDWVGDTIRNASTTSL